MNKQHTQILEKAILVTEGVLGDFKVVPRTKTEKLFLLVTLNDIVRKAKGMHSMLLAGHYGAVDSVGRAIFESFVDLLNLLKRPKDYPIYMQYVCDEQWLKSMRINRDDKESEYARIIRASAPKSLGSDVSEQVNEIERRMEDLRSRLPQVYFKGKNVDTTVLKRFTLAGKKHEYNSIYRLMSLSAHGTIGSMSMGVSHKDGISWPPENITYPLGAVASTTAILGIAGKDLTKKYKHSKNSAKVRAVEREFHELSANNPAD